ncbi:hypothetical protein LABALGNA3A7_09510 [Dellaglioa algida]|nr:hypothetical protein LABALGNA3A7_09510 [Dellaglioa algida]
MDKLSLDINRLAMGRVQQNLDHEFTKVIENILDGATAPGAKRSVSLKIEFKPDAARQEIQVNVSSSSSLAGRTDIESFLKLKNDKSGTRRKIQIAEENGQLVGQTFFDPIDSTLKNDDGTIIE